MFERRNIFVIILAFCLAAVVVFCLFKKEIVKNKPLLNEQLKQENFLSDETIEDNILTEADEEEQQKEQVGDTQEISIDRTIENKVSIEPKNIEIKDEIKTVNDEVKDSDMRESVCENENEDEKELTVGEMFRNYKNLYSDVPKSRPRADVVLINEEIKVKTPEKYSFQ